MTSHCRFVLKQLQNLAKNTKNTMSITSDYPSIRLTGYSTEEIDFSGTKSENVLDGVVDHLIHLGYLKQGYNKYTFSLTYKGLHPYRVGWERLRSFLLKSVCVPIVVSAATTLLTLWLKTL